MTAPGALEVRLFGRFVVVRDGSEIAAADFGGRKVRTLLRILATRRGEFVSHDMLTDMLWGEHPPADPAANLQVLINRARRALGRSQQVMTGPGGYSFARTPGCVVDAEVFLDAIAAAEKMDGPVAVAAYSVALALWRGEPLSEDAYASWASGYRDRLTLARQHALERAAQLALQDGRPSVAVEFAATAAAAEPLREVAVLTLVRALDAAGDRVAALERYDQYRRALAEDLGLDPSRDASAVHARLLHGEGGSRRPVTVRERPPEFPALPFVGRTSEFVLLTSSLAAGRTALVSGTSGAGKSRLLAALAAALPILSVRAFLAERDEPWSLLRTLVRELLDQDATAAEQLPPTLRSALVWLLPEFETRSASGDLPDPDAESRRSLLMEATVRLLAVAGAGLAVDDLQWADASSLWLLEAAAARLVGTGVVLAYRPEEIVAGSAASNYVLRARSDAAVVELKPFTVEDIDALSADDALTKILVDATDRTPLAVTEVLRSLAAEDAVTLGGGQRWRPATPRALQRAREIAVNGQHAMIVSRAGAQDPRMRELLDLLALIAREVPARALAVAAGLTERDVLDGLAVLSRAGLARLGEQGWATSHDMVSDVLVGALSDSERGLLHARVAGALDALGTEPGELARHWLGAGDAPRAAQSYLAASRQALDAFADDDAAALAGAGLELVPATPLRANLYEVRAEARRRVGDIPGARTDLHGALRSHPRGPLRAHLLGRLASLASGAEDLVRAAELAELALVEAGQDTAARAHALEIASVLDMNLDRGARAETRAAEALALYQQLSDANGAARVLDSRAMATFLDGKVDDGTDLLDRAANLFEDSGDLVHVITPRSTAGHGLVFADRAEHGLRKTTAALELARTIGHAEGQSYALWHTAEALAALDRGDEALDAGNEALAIATRIGHRGWTATAWRALGIAHQTRGDPERALAAFQNSLDLSDHLNLFASWAAARCALVLVERGQLTRAQSMVDRALSEGPPLGHYEARLAQVELAAARGDPSAATLADIAVAAADAGGVRQGRSQLLSRLRSTN